MQKKDIYNFFIRNSLMLLMISAVSISTSACGKKAPPLKPSDEKVK